MKGTGVGVVQKLKRGSGGGGEHQLGLICDFLGSCEDRTNFWESCLLETTLTLVSNVFLHSVLSDPRGYPVTFNHLYPVAVEDTETQKKLSKNVLGAFS